MSEEEIESAPSGILFDDEIYEEWYEEELEEKCLKKKKIRLIGKYKEKRYIP